MRRVGILLIILAFLPEPRLSFGYLQVLPALQEFGDETYITPRLFLDSPCVINFLSTFLETVRSCEILSEFFDFSLITSQEFSRKIQPFILLAHEQFEIPNAVQAAQSCIAPISYCKKTLTVELVARIHANSVSKVGVWKGALNVMNAESEALNYASILREHAKQFKASGDPDWRFPTLASGFIDFLTSLHLFSKKNCKTIGLIYSNEWKLASIS
ncbi:hypothetical protein NPIL_392541 [Nephila pilipes]|uniref:Uncharacterized protein n=1 Tax=Nephila pilipes TaxID=299642 RepID=A0A8X6N814_NEPPI|nr:hypothetical protein NPIL_392541 [Nephila pilipes]